MKKKTVFRTSLALILLNLIFVSFAINASSIDYTLDIHENDKLIWKVEKLNEDIYNSVFITEERPDFEEDDLIKYRITDIDKSSDYWKITYYIWDYTDDPDNLEGDADDDDTHKVYRDPEDQADDILLMDEIIDMWILPTPFTNYLDNFEEDFEHQVIRVYVEDDSLIAKISATDEIPSTYEVELTYDVNGVMKKLEYFDQTGSNFFELVLQKEAVIPGYDIYLILGILLICGLIGVIAIRKKLLISKK